MATYSSKAVSVGMPPVTQITQLMAQHGHLLLALGVVAVVALMILPVPPAILDALLAFNIAACVLLLMLSLYIPSALGLSTFPSLILLTTVLRLALNIASTKQILLHAHAGHVIETFGRLVMGGSVAVGLVVFAIIAVVQFIVISKGAERVAEVGARFTLDALPGKQMSIEADLRAGIIDKQEARRLRSQLQHESHLHGAMDGAMKFVKGDAIAAIIIALVNIVAGISIGVAAVGMSFSEAVARYTLLSVGDGMVSQIPSLLTSVAAGILITRTTSQDGQARGLAAQIGQQVFAQPMAIWASSAVLFALVLVPGFPKLTFAGLGLIVAGLGWLAYRQAQGEVSFDSPVLGSGAKPQAQARGTELTAQEAEHQVTVIPLQLRLPQNQRAQLSAAQLQLAMERERDRLQLDLGLSFPSFHVRFDEQLPDDQYVIDVQEIPALQGNVPTAALPPAGPASSSNSPAASATIEEQLAQQVASVVRLRPDAFVGMQEIQHLIKRAQTQLPDLSEEVLRAMSLQRVADVLRRLALEGVSLRYLREVYESLLVWNAREKDAGLLTDYVRIDLGRFICHRLLNEQRQLHAVTLDSNLELQLREAVQQGPNGTFIALPPELLQRLLSAVQATLAELDAQRPAVILATLETRRFLRRLFAPRFPQLQVLSYQELPPDAQIVSVAQLTLGPSPRLRVAGA